MAEEKKEDIEKYYVIKGRFRASSSNTYGLFIIFISLLTKTVENVLVAASHFSTIYENSPDMNWPSFEEKITNLKWKGEVSANISHDLQMLLSNTIKFDLVEELIDYLKRNEKGKIEHTFTPIFAKGLMDKSVAIEFEYEEVTQQDILRVKDERRRKEKEEQEALKREEAKKEEEERIQLEDGAVLLDASFILAPVSGIPINEAKPGDEIMIKILPITEKANYFIDLLNLRTEDGDIKPTKATIKDIFLNQFGEYQVISEIGPGIYGKITETEQVKIKQYNPEEEPIIVKNIDNQPSVIQTKPTSQTQSKSLKESRRPDYFIWIVGAISLILAFLIFYLLISGVI